MTLLVSYDARWPAVFEEIAVELRRHGRADWLIEHIGSTSIPGMPAKPIIDVAVRLSDRDEFEEHRPGLEAIGWKVGSGVRTHPVMVFEVDGIRSRIVHFFAAGEWDDVDQRIFRDWLRTHPDDAERYLQAKLAAAAGGPRSYNAGKTAVIQEIVDRARAARGLPRVTVGDKQR